MTLDSLTLSGNVAFAWGGAVFTTSAFGSSACTFEKNNANNGGAVAGNGTSIITIQNCTFSQNSATTLGGGVFSSSVVAGTNTEISLSSFNGNTAGNSGDAVSLPNAAGRVLNGNLFYGNGTGIEVQSGGLLEGAYNIVRATVNPFTDLGTNKMVDAGNAVLILLNTMPGDLVTLTNNGGPTRTFMLLHNGLAYNYIPKDMSWVSTVGRDQTGSTRARGCNVDAGSFELQISDPATSRWKTTGMPGDWNDSNNWDNWDASGNLMTEPAIPSICTNVIIPDQQIFYPEIQPLGSYRVDGTIAPQASCDTITFKFGGEVAKTSYLNYTFAKVDLTLIPNRWYMPAPVLQQQYSGDYLEDQSQFRINPEVSIMYYQTGNPQTGAARVASKFTGLFNNTDELLKAATGHALWVDNGTRPDAQFTFHFPKDSTQYVYYDTLTNEVTRISGIMPRDKRGRFIYEGNASYQSNQNGTFLQTIENSDLYPQVIIGNPYMSHLNVVAFQIQNDAYLDKSFRIWKNGTSYETYQINSDGSITGTGGPNDFQIPPMQSFIIDTKQLFSAPILFTPAMSFTQAGSTLRNSEDKPLYPEATNVLQVEITRNGIRQSGLALRFLEGESRHYNKNKDVWAIFPQNVGSYVSLYAVVDGGAASIHTSGDLTTPLDLGISVGTSIKKGISGGVKDQYSIRIPEEGTMYPGQEVYLNDKLKKITHNLTQSAYIFENTSGDITGRFQLFSKANPTEIEKISNSSIRITNAGGRIFVENTSGNLIQEINVFNILGHCLYNMSNGTRANYSFPLELQNQMVIIKVKSGNDYSVEKILLNK